MNAPATYSYEHPPASCMAVAGRARPGGHAPVTAQPAARSTNTPQPR
jgi:hypothetical protein